MYWKLLLLLGVFTKFSVSFNPTPLPALTAPIHDLRVCYENIANPGTTALTKLCHNFNDLRIQIHNYTTAFAEAHNNTDNVVPNEENIDLLEYAVSSANYASVVENMKCMNLTSAFNNCSIHFGPTTSNKSESLDKPKLHRVLFYQEFAYKAASCGRANVTKACVIETGFAECNDMVREWASDLFDYSINKCVNHTALDDPNSATGKYPLPLLMAFLVMTAASVIALSPASD